MIYLCRVGVEVREWEQMKENKDYMDHVFLLWLLSSVQPKQEHKENETRRSRRAGETEIEKWGPDVSPCNEILTALFIFLHLAGSFCV